MSRACEQETPGQSVEAESHLMAAGGFGSLSRDTFSGSETWPGGKMAGRMGRTKVQSGRCLRPGKEITHQAGSEKGNRSGDSL